MKLKGWVGTREDRKIVGWVVDQDNLESRFYIQAQIKGWMSNIQLANEYRPHLGDKKIGDGFYGYSLRVPEDVNIEEGSSITVSVTNLTGSLLGMIPYKADVSERFFIDKNYEDLANHSNKNIAHEKLKIISTGAFPERKFITSISDLKSFANDVLKHQRLAELLRDAGRALIVEKDMKGALALLTSALCLNPSDEETQYYCAIANSRLGQYDDALLLFKSLHSSNWRPVRVLSEYAQTLRRKLEDIGQNPSVTLIDEMKKVVLARVSIGNIDEGLLPPSIARILSRFGFFDLALQALDQNLAARPDFKEALVAKAHTLIEGNRINEGLETAEQVLKRWPEDEGAQYIKRVFTNVRATNGHSNRISWIKISENNISFLKGKTITTHDLKNFNKFEEYFNNLEADWIAIENMSNDIDLTALEIAIHMNPTAGFLQSNSSIKIWNVTAIRDLLEAKLVSKETFFIDLLKNESLYVRPAPRHEFGTVLLVSPFGSIRSDGNEEFLYNAAINYRSMGYNPLILGYKKNVSVTSNLIDTTGLRYDFIEENPISLRRLIFKEKVKYIHAISGSGMLAARALGNMNIPLIYGIHKFDNDLFDVNLEVYSNLVGDRIPQENFSSLLSRASTIYVTSNSAQAHLQKIYGVQCSIVYPVQKDEIE